MGVTTLAEVTELVTVQNTDIRPLLDQLNARFKSEPDYRKEMLTDSLKAWMRCSLIPTEE
jgi:hypothetical protein